jgi:hypothetical protein
MNDPRKPDSTMNSTSALDRPWIASELARLVALERTLAVEMKCRGESPPDTSLSVIYNEIAADDERHVSMLETIATRYGYTPSRTEGPGVSETLGRIKDKVVALGVSRSDRIVQDLSTKADALHRHSAWAGALEAIGDIESARGLAAVVAEEEKHRDALLESLRRLLEEEARGNHR